MPAGSKVDDLYKKLRSEGKSEESAARIAQSVTGEALSTGRPAKHENEKGSLEYQAGWAAATSGQAQQSPWGYGPRQNSDWNRGWMDGYYGHAQKDGTPIKNSAFQNGRDKALAQLSNAPRLPREVVYTSSKTGFKVIYTDGNWYVVDKGNLMVNFGKFNTESSARLRADNGN